MNERGIFNDYNSIENVILRKLVNLVLVWPKMFYIVLKRYQCFTIK